MRRLSQLFATSKPGINAGGQGKLEVILYSKPGCALCDEARDEIESVTDETFDLVEISIAGDLELYERYKNDIPVVFINGSEAFRHRLTAKEFARALRHSQ